MRALLGPWLRGLRRSTPDSSLASYPWSKYNPASTSWIILRLCFSLNLQDPQYFSFCIDDLNAQSSSISECTPVLLWKIVEVLSVMYVCIIHHDLLFCFIWSTGNIVPVLLFLHRHASSNGSTVQCTWLECTLQHLLQDSVHHLIALLRDVSLTYFPASAAVLEIQ